MKFAEATRAVPSTVMGGNKELRGHSIIRALSTGAMSAQHQGAPELTCQIPLGEKIPAAVFGACTHLHWNGDVQALEENCIVNP